MAKVRRVTTIAQKAAIIESLSGNSSVTTACKGASVSPMSYYRWLDNDPEFAAKCRAAMNSRIHVMKDVAFSNALKSSTDPRYQTSMLAWMNNEGGWVNPSKRELTGPNGAPINPVQIYIPSNGREKDKEASTN